MTERDHRTELSLVEAQLFASTDLAVITEIDASEDPGDAVDRLRTLGMTTAEAESVLEMPLRVRTRSERNQLLVEAERLRRLID